MIISLNEIESTALKAARGAGFQWGHAEEIGVAARWLAALDLGWAAALVALLEAPRTPDQCPIQLGCALADAGACSSERALGDVYAPLWLAPFCQRVAIATGSPVALTWPGVDLGVSGDRVVVAAPSQRLYDAGPVAVAITPRAEPSTGVAHTARPGGRAVDPVLWQRLGVFEAKTYVPASTRSRETGAGAGTSDND
jgi:Protein of unknown function (DUF3726)